MYLLILRSSWRPNCLIHACGLDSLPPFPPVFNNIYFLGVHKFWNLAEKVSGEVMNQNMTKHQSKEHVASDPFWVLVLWLSYLWSYEKETRYDRYCAWRSHLVNLIPATCEQHHRTTSANLKVFSSLACFHSSNT